MGWNVIKEDIGTSYVQFGVLNEIKVKFVFSQNTNKIN